MDFVTLACSDARFDTYLMGTFSSEMRALPVETSFAATTRERVTFKLVPVADLAIPKWWVVYLHAARPGLLGLTLGPVLLTWLNHRGGPPAWERPTAWLALLGVFFLHVAIFVMNDVQDHVRGTDRLNRRRGSRVIQDGWVTAAAMRTWARANLGLAVLCGLPAFWFAPLETIAVCLVAALAMTILIRNVGTRWGLADAALWALLGPLATLGTAAASFGVAGYEDLLLGLTLGFASLWVFQIRQFENTFRARPESFRTALGRLNFDGARRVLIVEAVILLAATPVAATLLRLPLIFLMVLPVFGAPTLARVQSLARVKSPLGSNLVGSTRGALIAHAILTAWWAIALGTAWL